MTGAPDSVLFDLGGVLFRYLPERRLARLVEMTGLAPETIHGAIWQSDFDQNCEAGMMSAAESHQTFCRLLGIEMTYEDFRATMAHAFDPDPAVFELARLVAARHGVAILTNNWEAVEEALVADHPALGEIFGPHLYFTWRLGGRKPAREIFERCLTKWGKRATQVLFVDDSERNVAGAQAAGLAVHHFTGALALATRLRELNLVPA